MWSSLIRATYTESDTSHSFSIHFPLSFCKRPAPRGRLFVFYQQQAKTPPGGRRFVFNQRKRRPRRVHPAPVGARFHPRPDAGMTADPVSPHQPRRGRRPRRPLPSFTAGPTAAQGLRAAGAARKGGTPGEGSPFDPLLRFVKHKESSARCGARPGLRPWTPPAFL